MKRILLLAVVVGGLAFLAGCQSDKGAKVAKFDPHAVGTNSLTVTRKVDAALLRPSPDLFTLGPGDEIEIEMLGTANSRTALTIGPDGKIYFNLLPGVDIWGLTIAQAKALLEKELEKYVSMPQVSISLRSVGSKYIWVLGKVGRPGIYPATGPMTLLEAISLAGGTAQSASQVTTTELADLKHAFVVRKGQALPVDFSKLLNEGDMTQNIYLQPDDFVYVPSGAAREIYVFGAVRMPRSLPLGPQTTVLSAISASGGPTRQAYVSHVAIVRGSLTTPQITVVDYGAIMRGKAADVPLEPHDIVYVPVSPYQILSGYLDTILTTFVNTVAANEGSYASGGSAISVSVPVGSSSGGQ